MWLFSTPLQGMKLFTTYYTACQWLRENGFKCVGINEGMFYFSVDDYFISELVFVEVMD